MVLLWWQFNFPAMLMDHTIHTHFLSPGQWHTVLTGSTRIPIYSRNMLYRRPQDSSKPGNQYWHEHQLVFWPFLVDQAMITYILAHCSGTEWWLNPPGHPFARERYSTKDQKTPQHPENRLCHKGKSMFWPFILNQTMNRECLVLLLTE